MREPVRRKIRPDFRRRFELHRARRASTSDARSRPGSDSFDTYTVEKSRLLRGM